MPEYHLRRRSDYDSRDPVTLRALLVDDDRQYLALLAALVTRFGFEVTEAADGDEALTLMQTQPRFDVLIVDCEMPRIDGLAMIRRVRSDLRHADVYAVMLTAREDVETKISALRNGFDDFMSKADTELEIAAKLSAAKRLVTRQHRLDAAVRELYGLATRDELTGVYNRRYFFSQAETLLGGGGVVSLVFFDLDDFKPINDNYGHLAGDRILRDVGALFTVHTRPEDLVARYGGDEFLMLVTALPPPEVEAVTQRLAAQIAEMQWTFGDSTVTVEATTGIAFSSLVTNPTLPKLLSVGDRDLYKNKWVRKHPDLDASLYEYDTARDAHVLEFVSEITGAARR